MPKISPHNSRRIVHRYLRRYFRRILSTRNFNDEQENPIRRRGVQHERVAQNSANANKINLSSRYGSCELNSEIEGSGTSPPVGSGKPPGLLGHKHVIFLSRKGLHLKTETLKLMRESLVKLLDQNIQVEFTPKDLVSCLPDIFLKAQVKQGGNDNSSDGFVESTPPVLKPLRNVVAAHSNYSVCEAVLKPLQRN
ncbi:hypothetical protein IEQ34_012512 [Dendrobium chrysotoxum]|uniref:Uncharacterized protein n=1 Tax=Dendrobium chrysotoxum TaxID=161865 RepID=A0AAV7GVG2_DENCH|nr:hypothetical protein IEQ34_012512 [Dendrobium chrysotoxum]